LKLASHIKSGRSVVAPSRLGFISIEIADYSSK
jgi:hypothetical protein